MRVITYTCVQTYSTATATRISIGYMDLREAKPLKTKNIYNNQMRRMKVGMVDFVGNTKLRKKLRLKWGTESGVLLAHA